MNSGSFSIMSRDTTAEKPLSWLVTLGSSLGRSHVPNMVILVEYISARGLDSSYCCLGRFVGVAVDNDCLGEAAGNEQCQQSGGGALGLHSDVESKSQNVMR